MAFRATSLDQLFQWVVLFCVRWGSRVEWAPSQRGPFRYSERFTCNNAPEH